MNDGKSLSVRVNKLILHKYFQTVEIANIKIFHYSGSLNFACKQYFRDEIYKVSEIVPRKELNKRLKAASNGINVEETKKVNLHNDVSSRTQKDNTLYITMFIYDNQLA